MGNGFSGFPMLLQKWEQVIYTGDGERFGLVGASAGDRRASGWLSVASLGAREGGESNAEVPVTTARDESWLMCLASGQGVTAEPASFARKPDKASGFHKSQTKLTQSL